jgi:hypothetical protein
VDNERHPFLCIPISSSRETCFFISRTTSIWLGGTSIPSNWLHNFFKNISVYLFSELTVVHFTP